MGKNKYENFTLKNQSHRISYNFHLTLFKTIIMQMMCFKNRALHKSETLTSKK